MNLTADEKLVWAAAFANAMADEQRGADRPRAHRCVARANAAIAGLREPMPTGVEIPIDVSR